MARPALPKFPKQQMPGRGITIIQQGSGISDTTDFLEYANLASFPVTGTTGTFYVALDTEKVYRWTGSIYVEVSNTTGYVTLTGAETLTNKRITNRTSTITSSATPTLNTDTTDVLNITALATNITSLTTNLTGTPVDGDELTIVITDDGTVRTVTHGSGFEATNVALLTQTVANIPQVNKYRWSSISNKWQCYHISNNYIRPTGAQSLSGKKTFDVSGTNSDIAMGNIEVYGDTTVQEILFNAILSAGVYTYKSNGFASKYVQAASTGNIFIYTAVSGTAGNTITWVLKTTTSNDGSMEISGKTTITRTLATISNVLNLRNLNAIGAGIGSGIVASGETDASKDIGQLFWEFTSGTGAESRAVIQARIGGALTSVVSMDKDDFSILQTKLDLTKGQIKFPATANPSADANTLDDYEEGTFPPAGAFGGGNTGMAFSAALGYYEKIGRKVLFEAILGFSAKGSSTGSFQLTGLPFPSNSSSICVTSISVDKIVSLGQLSTLLVGGGTAIDLYQTTLAGANTAVDDTAFANDSVIAINGFYYV